MQHRHILIRGLGQASDSFEPYGGGSVEHPSAVSNRAMHAARLRGDLGRLAAEARGISEAQAEVGVPQKKRGVTVTVTGRTSEQLIVGESRRANSKTMQLLNVRRQSVDKGGHRQDRAIYYLNDKAIQSLETSLNDYENWRDPEGDRFDRGHEIFSGDRRPRNFWLFESADSFRLATVEDLWTDELGNFPRERGVVEWEIWVRNSMRLAFEAAVARLGVQLTGEASEFVDILVYNGSTTKRVLAKLIMCSAAVVELRAASNFIAEHADLPPPARLAQIQGIAKRVVAPPASAPWISLLDTGVNPSNALLAPALPKMRCRAVVSAWDPYDRDGHGSKMAGVALYGDLSEIASGKSQIPLETGLESIAVRSGPHFSDRAISYHLA